MKSRKYVMGLPLLCVLFAALFIIGCAKLKESKPIFPVKEYEKMLLGKITANYVGNENCLKNCHTHDKLALDFKSSTMGDQLAQSSHGMQIVDCESCHGPGSDLMDAIQGLNVEKPQDYQKIVEAHNENLLDYDTLPAGALSLICLKCHTANATFNIHNWNISSHAANEVSCSSCHPIHAGSDLITEPRAVAQLCLDCHVTVSAQFSLPSHHPVKEGKMYCSDCHDPHGSANPANLKRMSQKETCGRCHGDKVGPFLFEHGDITEECTNCHSQHGSVNNNLLKIKEAFLCKQCHTQHRISDDDLWDKSMSFTRCTDCHSMIHGSDNPGMNEGGAFTR